jgi:hypothetical protein
MFRRSLIFAALLTLPCSAFADDAIDYAREIKPLLKQRCFACHGVLQQKGKLRLDSGALIRKGGRDGPAVKPGDAAGSLLIERVSDPEEATRMPPEGKPLTQKQITLLKAWIDQGATFPASDKPETDPRDHWAFKKPTRPALPKVQDSAWGHNPIDALLAAKHATLGLAASPPAEKHVLLRRVTLDLLGLPPTRSELQAFLADDAADAYEKVVDRLLARPEYAERWARHWMDVWRYSDWYGRRSVPDVLNSYTMIWRWRDWIVRSVNADKGYDSMIVEMLAADEVAPTDDANLVATGFIVRNIFRWNYEQWKKDLVEHTGKAFLGLTLNCCHCHDHKYDPITQEEYFRFRAFFEPLELRHDRVPGEPDPGPYPKYDYGKSYAGIKSGMVRVFDEKLDAPTFMYSGGDARNRIAGRPPVAPGVPATLGGALHIEPIDLPSAAWFPGLKPFVQQEEIARRATALSAAEAALKAAQAKAAKPAVVLAEAQRNAARAELAAIGARIAADRARHGGVGNADQLAKAASRAERAAKVEAAKVLRVQKPSAAAEKAVAAAEKALTVESTAYTPLSATYPPKTTGRRTALARWIASKENPLTARVAVNYLWGWHFGRPLVDSTFDFGRNGKLPSHPELLDWLAIEFMENGWSMKHLHKLVVTSTAYRMRAHVGGDGNPNVARDPDNRYLWRFATQRMEAEVIRDSLLYLAGDLDVTRGGTEIPYEQGLTSRRRSIYFAHHGEGRMPWLELFDAANASDCYKRTVSVVPQQALALNNSELPLRLSRVLARKLWQEAGKGQPDAEERFVRAAFEQVLGRPPSPAESAASAAFLARQAKLFQASGLKGTPASGDVPAAEPQLRARENLVHVLFNHNDFVTIR